MNGVGWNDGRCDRMNLKRFSEVFGKEGRRDRYERWVREHSEDLYRFAFRLCGEADTADDLVQETFYHAWKDMGKLRHKEKAKAWLFQILRYRYAHWVRERSRRPVIAGSAEPLEDHAQTAATPFEVLANRESVQMALDTLEDRFKLPLLMVFMEGLTCQETADYLDIPLGTVLSRIHRARRRLRRSLGEQADSSAGDAEKNGRGHVLKPRLRLGGGA